MRKKLLLITAVLVLAGCSGCTKNIATESEINTEAEFGSEAEQNNDSDTSDDAENADASEKTEWEINRYVIKADTAAYLSDEEKEGYRTLLDAVFEQQESVTLFDDYDANLNVLTTLEFGPYGFLVDESNFSDNHTTIYFTYTYSKEEQDEICAFIDSEYKDILGSIIKADMNDVDKTLAVYKYFAERIQYDYEWYDELMASETPYEMQDVGIYDGLKNNKGVCHTYTYLCEFALQQMGIECLRVSGVMQDDENEAHMWLVAKLDGKYYHMDPTWDAAGEYGNAGLVYFGMTDEERIESGVWVDAVAYDESYGEVVCDDNRFAELHDVYQFEYAGDHNWTIYRLSEDGPVNYNTETGVIVR